MMETKIEDCVFKTNISHQKNYEIYWITPFPEGKQKLYMVSGNTDSSDFHTAINAYKWFESDKVTFLCYIKNLPNNFLMDVRYSGPIFLS